MQDTQKQVISSLEKRIRIDLPSKGIQQILHSQNYLIAVQSHRILTFNTLTKKRMEVSLPQEGQFTVHLMAPYLFVVMVSQYIYLYSEDSLKDDKCIVIAKISKLEPTCISRFNNGYFMGGYNRSVLPGHKRSTRRELYFIEKLTFKEKNRPNFLIKLENSSCPVSQIFIQNPYLVVYCQPNIYVISLFNHEILLIFQKQLSQLLILEGRFAANNLNGIGVSLSKKLFTFDVERLPLYGVEISEHPIEGKFLCLEKTGKVYAAKHNTVFQYNPFKQSITNVITYPEPHQIIAMVCIPSNHLLVLLQNTTDSSIIDVFSLD